MSTNIMYEVAYPLSLFLCLKNFILLTLLRLAAVLPLSLACPVGLCWTLCACSKCYGTHSWQGLSHPLHHELPEARSHF